MAQAGIDDILIANQIIGEQKIGRLANLAHHCNIMVAVEAAGNVADLSNAAQHVGSTIRILIEVDVGMHRCGVKSAEEALSLAQLILNSPGLVFEGIMGYEGHVVMVPDFEDREKAALAEINKGDVQWNRACAAVKAWFANQASDAHDGFCALLYDLAREKIDMSKVPFDALVLGGQEQIDPTKFDAFIDALDGQTNAHKEVLAGFIAQAEILYPAP